MSDVNRLVVYPYDLENASTSQQSNQQNNLSGNTVPVIVNHQPMQTSNPPPPVDAFTQTEKKRPKKDRKTNDKQMRIIKMSLFLANNQAFNNDLHVKKSDGSFNNKSNISKLLTITQRSVKDTEGIEDLIYQMYLAKISPEWIMNEIVKRRLLELMRTSRPSVIIDNQDRPRPPKRRRTDNDNVNDDYVSNENPDVTNWEIPFNEKQQNTTDANKNDPILPW